ncbi:hypothetical protein [Jannaschia aquimarina]|uniref:Uncharacterized protein n=1 Tax=Jannaschia aquimarina TaxID=935700 RepID=A0A0D1CL49_9RHOB|nr:hypothetical protein [Jannaschia aquimarina]KIT15527.1 hypothetical protein jaqu_27750 [Jannaschia aquimarina]SNT34553.1 hypothetical protein SAMN05421775_11256 [Jannaschia aquimarina]
MLRTRIAILVAALGFAAPAAAQEVRCSDMLADMSEELRSETGWYVGSYARVKDRGAVTHNSTANVTFVRASNGTLQAQRMQEEFDTRTDRSTVILHPQSGRVEIVLHSWGNARLRGQARYCRYRKNQDFDIGGQPDNDTMLIFGTYDESNGQSFFTLALSRMGPIG